VDHSTPAVSTLFLGAVLVFLPFAATANDLNFPHVELARESSAAIPLEFQPSAEPVVALQFDLEYDSSAIQLLITPGAAARLAGKSIYSAELSATRTRFLILGWNQTAILVGPVVQFVAGVTATASLQDYTLQLSNLIATFPNGKAAPLTASNGVITVRNGDGDRLSAAGVLSGASLAAGPVAPGQITSLLGQGIGPRFAALPEEGPSSYVLGGTRVWFDGVQAPLLYAGPNQINLVTPFGVVAGGTTEILVQKEGLETARLSVPVVNAAPALFTLDASGMGAGAILNEDTSLNSTTNPAQRGRVISIFATGAGQLDPGGKDGAIATGTTQRPVLPVTVRIGGLDAQVLYAGSAPGLIEGLLQINCRVPAEVDAGPAVDLVVTVGSTNSPAGTTLAIR